MVNRAVTLVAIVVLRASTAGCQTPDVLPCSREDRTTLEEGASLVARREYAQAAARLEPLVARCPTSGAMYALATAWRALGRAVDAIALLERYLQADPAADRPSVQAAIVAMRQALVALDLRVSPADATVSIDGRATTPQNAPAWLDPVAHVVEVRAPGFVAWRRAFPAQVAGRLVVEVDLRASDTTGHLTVATSVPSAEIVINGALVGRGHAASSLAPGGALVEVRAAGFEPWRRTVNVEQGAQLRVEPLLISSPEALPRRGWVLPTAIAGGVVAVAATVAAVLWFARGTEPPMGPADEVVVVPSR